MITDDPNNPNQDIVEISITLNVPSGTNISNTSIDGLINLCTPTGEVICYNLIYIVKECDICLGDITVLSSCADPDPFDNVYVYTGSVNLTLPPGNYVECDPVSTSLVYSQTV